MTRPRRRPLRKGQKVWLWYGDVVSAGTFQRRGIYVLRDYCRIHVHGCGDVHYAQRCHVHLCREDAANAR